jgi:hypothetical protein
VKMSRARLDRKGCGWYRLDSLAGKRSAEREGMGRCEILWAGKKGAGVVEGRRGYLGV